jgi:hypothetical protein
MIWVAIIAGSIGCYLLKLWGWALPGAVVDHPVVSRLGTLLPITLLAALVAVQVAGDGQGLSADARLAGLAVATVALLLRAPFLVVVLVSAATAAALRWVGWAT